VGPDWQQVIDKIARGRYLPLLLVYADHDDVPRTQSHQSLSTLNVKDYDPSNTGRGQTKLSANRKGMLKIRW